MQGRKVLAQSSSPSYLHIYRSTAVKVNPIRAWKNLITSQEQNISGACQKTSKMDTKSREMEAGIHLLEKEQDITTISVFYATKYRCLGTWKGD